MKYKIGKFCKWLKNYVKEYCKETSFHGLKYIGADNTDATQSTIWSIICLLGFLITGIMSYSALQRISNLPTMTSMESMFHPLGKIPFPGVTICNNNKLYLPGASKLIASFESYGVNSSEFRKFLEELDSLINNEPVEDIQNAAKYTEILQKLGYDSEKLMFELSQPCSKLLKRCKWLGREYNCSLAFQMIKTPHGFCCSFNWHGSDLEDDEIVEQSEENPFTDVIFVRSAGSPRAGLSVVLDLQENQFVHFRGEIFGAAILFHDCTDYPEYSVQEAFIEPSHHINVRVEGSLIESGDNVRTLPPRIRKCYFDDELSLESSDDYSFQTCMTEHMLRRIINYCKCMPFYYPKIIDIRICTLMDVQCLREFQFIITRVTQVDKENEMANCLPQCTDKFYHLSVISTEVKTQKKLNKKHSTLNVFFREVFCVKYRKDSLMTWDGVLSTLGGIFGLCLGGSILSLIEMIYFFTYHIWIHVRKKKPDHSRSSTLLFKKTEKLRGPQIIVKKSLPEIFELEYKNIIKKNTVSPVGSHMCFEGYCP